MSSGSRGEEEAERRVDEQQRGMQGEEGEASKNEADRSERAWADSCTCSLHKLSDRIILERR